VLGTLPILREYDDVEVMLAFDLIAWKSRFRGVYE